MSAATDQWLAAIHESERRAALPDSLIVPWDRIDADPLLRRVVEFAHRRSPVEWRVGVDGTTIDPDTVPPDDPRAFLRSVQHPGLVFLIDLDHDHDWVYLAREATSFANWYQCDRCSRLNAKGSGVILADTPPNYLAVNLCGECVEVCGVADYTIKVFPHR